MNHDLPDVQPGFRKGRGTESRKTSISALLTMPKTFDCVDHNKLWKILQEMGIPDHLTCLLRNLYAGQEATVRNGHGTTGYLYLSKVRFLNLEESHLQKLVLKQLGCKNTDVMNGISQYLGISESYPFNFSIHIFFDSQNVEFQRHNKITFTVWITSKKRSFFCQVQTSHYQAQSKIRLPEFPSANGMFTMI